MLTLCSWSFEDVSSKSLPKSRIPLDDISRRNRSIDLTLTLPYWAFNWSRVIVLVELWPDVGLSDRRRLPEMGLGWAVSTGLATDMWITGIVVNVIGWDVLISLMLLVNGSILIHFGPVATFWWAKDRKFNTTGDGRERRRRLKKKIVEDSFLGQTNELTSCSDTSWTVCSGESKSAKRLSKVQASPSNGDWFLKAEERWDQAVDVSLYLSREKIGEIVQIFVVRSRLMTTEWPEV